MSERPNILLDLDNTIISSVTPHELKKIKDQVSGLKYTNMKHYFRIFHRPYLQEFLDFAFENFNVTVWTAGSKDYCLFIVENIILRPEGYKPKEERHLKLILYDENCDQSEEMYKTDTPKDLRYIYNFPGYSKDNTFIVDDLSEVQKVNKNNVLPAKYFDVKLANCKSDTFLRDVIPTLKKMLDKFYTKNRVEFTPRQ